ncbi:MAG: class I SAM-dependent methyltransferase [Betaproteobacteria bacterium]|nr:MAG: class I SAM-dependent methyltransferase [Betaproteobacteria bacterium]
MKALRLRYDAAAFWKEYWQKVDVDPPEFIDLDIYPIYPTIKYVKKTDRILECGFGGGRVVRHLVNHEFAGVVGVEYDFGAAARLRAAQPAPLSVADVRRLPFANGTFDVSMAFGVVSGLQHDISPAITELGRVTRPGGHVIVSVMVDNVARRLQLLVNRVSRAARNHPLSFYAWMDTIDGWQDYLRTFGLDPIERSLMTSRYNIYYWSPLLRDRRKKFDHKLARVKDSEFPLNRAGEWIHRMTTVWCPSALAGAVLFVCRKRAG